MKPGVRVEGRLDEAVPRPVKNGRVSTRVFADKHDGSSGAPVWITWASVAEDGNFVFDSLPPGRMELIGMCDGYVSRNEKPVNGRTTSMRCPQLFALSNAREEVRLLMEPAAFCELTILDDTGNPLAGATAYFSPNVLWGGNGSTIFCGHTHDSADFFRGIPRADRDAEDARLKGLFNATSDRNGIALVPNLLPENLHFSVDHTNYVVPVDATKGSRSRSITTTFSPGETNRLRVLMQKRGLDAVTH